MKPLTVVAPYQPGPFFQKTLTSLTKSPLVESIMIVTREPVQFLPEQCHLLVAPPLSSQETVSAILERTRTDYLFLQPGNQKVSVSSEALGRMIEVAEASEAGLVYSDFYEETDRGKARHTLNDWQLGSVRDDFGFGALILFSMQAVRKAIEKYGLLPGIRFGSLYDLRLKVSIDHKVFHLREPLYSVIKQKQIQEGEKIFAYVDPRNESVQKEMEIVFTDYLKRIGAYLPQTCLRHFTQTEQETKPFPVEASVIIPVRNRRETVSEAVKSALSQKADFPFNILVIDNHSTDGTTAVLSLLAGQYSIVKHITPKRLDLGIGGCWNEALWDGACGRYVVQLDSDDLYRNPHTLQNIVDMLRKERLAMVVGSYTLVNSSLEEISPGLIAHREWTDENGHNNALRINGLGAPRAFNTEVMRSIGFVNVSYGEDYAAALRICREYRIGRIYESLYLCRRWQGNTDASLTIEEANRNDAFKDKIRTDEILARQKRMNH
jgi:hypothetical protein